MSRQLKETVRINVNRKSMKSDNGQPRKTVKTNYLMR